MIHAIFAYYPKIIQSYKKNTAFKGLTQPFLSFFCIFICLCRFFT